MNDVAEWNEQTAMDDVDDDLTVDFRDFPAKLRLKIDSITRQHSDLESRTAAVEALLYGSRRPSEVDAESGIEVSDSDSATASVTSSEVAAAVSAVLPTTTSVRRDNMNTISAEPDDIEEFIRSTMVRPPPSTTVCLDDRPVAVTARPSDVVNHYPDPPLSVDYAAYNVLPPLVELPEDDQTPSFDDVMYGVPPPPTSITDSSRNVFLDECDDLTSLVYEEREAVDENFNSLTTSTADGGDGKYSYRPVAAKRNVKTRMINSVDDDNLDDVSRTATRHVTPRTSSTLPVTASDDASSRSVSIAHLPRRHFPADTDAYNDSRKKTGLWKRFLKRDLESGGGMTSSTGFSWFPSRKTQSTSVAESTATLRRRPKDQPLQPLSTSTQSKIAALAAAKAKTRSVQISLPTDFRVLTSDTGLKSEQRSASDEHLDMVDRGGSNQNGTESEAQFGYDDVDRISSVSDDGVTAVVNLESINSSAVTAPRRPKKNLPVSSQFTSKQSKNAAAKGREISLPTNFRVLKSGADLKLEQCLAPVDVQVSSMDHGDSHDNRCSSTRAENDSTSSASDDDLTEAEDLEMRAKMKEAYRDERGRLSHATIDPRILNSSTLGRLRGSEDEGLNSRYPATSTLGRPAHWSSGFVPRNSPTSGKLTLTSVGATLPRLYRLAGVQSSDEDQSRRHADSPTAGADVEQHDIVDELRRSEYLQIGRDRPSPSAVANQLLRRSFTGQKTTSTQQLFDVFDALPTLNDDKRPSYTAGGGGGCFNTFRGALKPVRWSEERPARTRHRSLSVDMGRQVPGYVDVRPPTTSTSEVVSDTGRRPSMPVAAPRSLNVASSTTTEKQRPQVAQKPKKPQLFTQSAWMMASGVTSPVHQWNSEEEDSSTVDDCRVSSNDGRSSDVFDEDIITDDCTTCLKVIESVANMTYSKSSCAEAIADIEAMIAALERLRSLRCEVDVLTTTPPDADSLSASVRQLVTDSKNMVAGAMSWHSDRESGLLRALVETAMHTLASVFYHCCRLMTALDVVDNVLDAASSLRTTVEAVRVVVDGGPDLDEMAGNRTALLATAGVLAKSLSVLVQKARSYDFSPTT